MLTSILSYVIPDMPNNLRTQLLRERQLQKEMEFQFDRTITKLAKSDLMEAAALVKGEDGQQADDQHMILDSGNKNISNMQLSESYQNA